MKNGERSLKKVDYKELSQIKCYICGEILKQNSVNKGHKICYVCHKVSGKNPYKRKYKVENGSLIRPLVLVSEVKWRDLQIQNMKRNGRYKS